MDECEGKSFRVVIGGADSKEEVFLASSEEPSSIISRESVSFMKS